MILSGKILYVSIYYLNCDTHFFHMKINRKFLPKPLYEILPFLYLALGTGGLLANHSLGLDILCAYLLARGLFKMILRINYRSPRQALTKSPSRHREQ